MPGMRSQLHAVINQAGVYDGFSANYSGDGFSGMRFKFHGLNDQGFEQWVRQARASGATLDRAAYLKLEQPSKDTPVQRYAAVAPRLFNAAVERCVDASKMCMGQMMAIDAAGGLGKNGIAGLARQPWRGSERQVVAGLCTAADPQGQRSLATAATPAARLATDL
jgi:cytochrome o ubiquinol oxidase subunit 2